ncbi:MAG: response regulator transcription factor [Tissierellia bacterium]|nr:response regulator transcription factor [Tissierellia bacterium]
MTYKILACDDEKDIVRAIEIFLTAEGYEVYTANDGIEALEVLKNNEIDLVILDLMMPRMDGITALVKIRANYTVPVIILSAKSEFEDKVLGLNIGADDYVTKPFNSIELMARVKSLLRRSHVLNKTQKPKEEVHGIYELGRLKVDDIKKEVFVEGESISLTPFEYKILLFLIKNAGRVYSSNAIYEHVWDEAPINAKKIISVHICHLRNKIEIDPRNPELLKSIYGMGYKLEG